MLQALHELGEIGCDFCGRVLGSVDHRQAEGAMPLRIVDALGDAIQTGLLAQSLAPLLVGAIQQHPGIDRPARQFIGRAHGKEDHRQVGYRRHDGADQLPVGEPGFAMLGDLPSGQRGRGRHEGVPVQHHMGRQE